MATVFEYFHQPGAEAKRLFPSSYLEQAQRLARVAEVSRRPLTPEVIASLISQNHGAASLKFLDGRALAFVVTGQQLGVLGGPLFTLYKIASAIRVAEALSAESGIPVLPLFWLQSEDHDYAEIRNTHILSRDSNPVEFALPENPPGIGGPVGKIVLSHETAESLRSFLTSNYAGRAPAERIDEIAHCYREGETLAQAMASLVKTCFRDTPLLVLDANTRELKHFAAPHLLRFFTESSAIEALLEDRSAFFATLGLTNTVPLRQGYPLPFLEVRGKRERIRASSGSFTTSRGPLSFAELSQQVERTPEIITTSALARPLFQDFLLPTAAYVAGPTEFNYWAQIPGLYDFFKIPMPVVVPRGKFAVLPENRARMLEEEKLSLTEVQLPLEKLLELRVAGSAESPERVFQPADTHLTALESELLAGFSHLDSKLLRESLAQTSQAMRHNLEKLKTKYLRTLTERHQTFTQRAEKLQRLLLPKGELQERIISFSHFYLLEGDLFVKKVLSNLTFPFSLSTQLLTIPPESKGNLT
jgi:bacillithiol biosynthesis cysteine-adding enzyme BshC